MSGSIPRFLCDTWWFGLTKRLSEKRFKELANLRKKQGFNAIQLVLGIPPEIGPQNPNAKGEDGAAWNLEGEFNQKYLETARGKIKYLNSLGFLVIVYGAWGYQIEWIGKSKMVVWWREIVSKVDDLNVIYCLTGESDLWVGEENKLLPDKTTNDLNVITQSYPGKRFVKKLFNRLRSKGRRNKWSLVLKELYTFTKRPIIIHPIPNKISEETVNNPDLLTAITVQSGHDFSSRRDLLKLPLSFFDSDKPFINLEPWYEGIKGRFNLEDQLYSYWVSMMAGAHAYCYGAHGIWNVGDGEFLSHWGGQTFEEAKRLDTPRLIGESHKFFIKLGFANYKKIKVVERGSFINIIRTNKEKTVHYINDLRLIDKIPQGKIFN